VLPATIDGVFWSYSTDNKLIGDVLTPPGLSLAMIGTGNLEFRTKRIQVCPVLEYDSMQGRWADPFGATIRLVGRSTCLPGRCVLSTFSQTVTLDTAFLTLDTEDTLVTVLFRSNSKQVNFELACSSLGETATVLIVGELDDPVPVIPVPDGIQPDGFNQWFDNLSLGGKIGVIIGIVVGSLLIMAVLIALLWFMPELLLMCYTCHHKMKGHRHVNDDDETTMSEKDKEEEAEFIDEDKGNTPTVKESLTRKRSNWLDRWSNKEAFSR
jgi:hypothetical protein